MFSLRARFWRLRTHVGTRIPALGFLAGRHPSLEFSDNELLLGLPVVPESNLSGDRYRRLIFLHIPKCGGSTIARAARACTFHAGGRYRYSALHTTNQLSPGWSGVWEKIANTPREELDKLTSVHGHVPFGVDQYFSGPSRYITLVRNPVAREISSYSF